VRAITINHHDEFLQASQGLSHTW